MSLPVPKAGLVIRYSFLWNHEARRGAAEGRKDRPVAIVVAVRKADDGDVRVTVAPITHEPSDDRDASIEIPTDVIRTLGLDGRRQWLRLDQVNRFSWPGFDLRPIPGRPGTFDYGMLPKDLYDRLKAGLLERQKARTLTVTSR